MRGRESAAAVAALLSLAAMLLARDVDAALALTPPGAPAITAVTRNNNGDMFTAPDAECSVDTCVGLSSGTAGAAPLQSGNGRSCTCRCLDHLPAYRDDLRICVDDIHECALAPFVSGSTSQQIPFVFLPLKGQIVHPSKEISFTGVQTPICAVSGAQFLTEGGWIELRNPIDNDVPFRLFRDEGRTFLQWLGEAELRVKMAGRLIFVQMVCKDLAKDPASTDFFTPCVAFRVAGTPTKYISNVSEVIFSPDAHASETGTPGGLSVSEYIAIGICSVLLGLIYVASVFLYLHIRRRRRKEILEKDAERRDDQSLAPGEEGVIKNNPLLSLSRHFTGPENTFSDSGSSDNEMAPDILQHQEDNRKKANMQITSAIIHPLNENFSMSLSPAEPMQMQDSSSIERHPEENVSIVETLEGREDRPETVKTIVNATTRRKLYFNPAYFEPHLLLAPPPAAIEFLTKIREVIAIAKHKMATKRFTPSLLGIPEEDSGHSREPMYEFPLGGASSRRSSMISLKRENSRRRSQQCTGCPGCEPHDLKSLCGKLPEFPSIAVCQSCSGSTSSVSESKQQSIRKWLEDVPILKQSANDDLSDEEDTSLPLVKALNPVLAPESVKSFKSVHSSVKSHYSEKTTRTFSPEPVAQKEIGNAFIERAKSPLTKPPAETKAGEKGKPAGIKPRSAKQKAPPPPVLHPNPKVIHHALKKPVRKTEDIKHTLSNQYDVIRNIRSPSPKHLPPPDMINEAIVVDQAEDVPQVTKKMMAAVINEFATHCEKTKPEPGKLEGNVEYESDSLERNGKKKNGYSTPTDYGDVSSSQPSPSLSAALPMDEEMTMRNEILTVRTVNKTSTVPSPEEDEHDYELIVLKKQDQKPLLDVLDKKLYNLPELLQRGSGYNLVSEVYVNNGYNFGSAPSTPSGSNSSTLDNQKPKIRYEQPDEKPGHLTIEVEDCPSNYIRVDDSDSFEPDTLDRKSSKFKFNSSSDATSSSDYIDSLERPRQILLRTTGSFKSDTLNNASEIGSALNSNFVRAFGSLREIYEAKTRNYLRPSLDNINFMGPLHSPNLTTPQRTLSWKRYKEDEEGKILTLEERQKKRQRRSPNGSLRQIPPDVIPPSPIQSPIYEHPKPPRKVMVDTFKPPLPPKNGNGRNTSTKTSSFNNKGSSPFSTISSDLPNSPSGVSAHSFRSSEGEFFSKPAFVNDEQSKSILNDFIHSNDVVFKNGFNNQLILHASTVTSLPTFNSPFMLSSKYNSPEQSSYTKNFDRHMRDRNRNETVKKTWRKLVHQASNQQREDSGYLSTDSYDSSKKKKDVDKESETDESLGDGHSESGAESIETHSVFFGTYRKFARVTESVDSGVGSDSLKYLEDVVLSGENTNKQGQTTTETPG